MDNEARRGEARRHNDAPTHAAASDKPVPRRSAPLSGYCSQPQHTLLSQTDIAGVTAITHDRQVSCHNERLLVFHARSTLHYHKLMKQINHTQLRFYVRRSI